MKNAKTAVVAIALAFAAQGGYGRQPSAESPPSASDKAKSYDGYWWLRAEPDERSGFLNGAADCLTWVAHAKWLRYDVRDLDGKIGKYYATHPHNKALAVTGVWEKVLSASQPVKALPGGEVWTNPHGYYDGLWWRQGPDLENKGFVEGYLGCMRSCVQHPSETYSRTVDYYADQISKYIRDHPKADDEAIATILSRFRDHPQP